MLVSYQKIPPGSVALEPSICPVLDLQFTAELLELTVNAVEGIKDPCGTAQEGLRKARLRVVITKE